MYLAPFAALLGSTLALGRVLPLHVLGTLCAALCCCLGLPLVSAVPEVNKVAREGLGRFSISAEAHVLSL